MFYLLRAFEAEKIVVNIPVNPAPSLGAVHIFIVIGGCRVLEGTNARVRVKLPAPQRVT
jgi:hypothetical protein